MTEQGRKLAIRERSCGATSPPDENRIEFLSLKGWNGRRGLHSFEPPPKQQSQGKERSYGRPIYHAERTC